MRKKIIGVLLAAVLSLSLLGCGPGDYDGKIVNNTIVMGAKVTGLENPAYRQSECKVHTDKGDFVIYSSRAEYFEQLKDFYSLKQNTGKDLIINIMYINNKKIGENMYEIRAISISE